jgi:hypothetical protein
MGQAFLGLGQNTQVSAGWGSQLLCVERCGRGQGPIQLQTSSADVAAEAAQIHRTLVEELSVTMTCI